MDRAFKSKQPQGSPKETKGRENSEVPQQGSSKQATTDRGFRGATWIPVGQEKALSKEVYCSRTRKMYSVPHQPRSLLTDSKKRTEKAKQRDYKQHVEMGAIKKDTVSLKHKKQKEKEQKNKEKANETKIRPIDVNNIPFIQTKSKSSLACFLPDEYCPFCLCEHTQQSFKCSCCQRYICETCCKAKNIGMDVKRCPLCEERNNDSGINKLIEQIWND